MTSDDYDDGYMAGLNGEHAELRTWQLGDHASGQAHRGMLQTVRGVLWVLVSRRGIVD